jgi:hypothetical protein
MTWQVVGKDMNVYLFEGVRWDKISHLFVEGK